MCHAHAKRIAAYYALDVDEEEEDSYFQQRMAEVIRRNAKRVKRESSRIQEETVADDG
jgi:hypothetical protein